MQTTTKDTWTSKEGLTYTFTWTKGNDMEAFRPFTQVYGVCFNEKGEILVHNDEDSPWGIPGGSPEEGETPEETLKRELLEESDVEVVDCQLLGGQMVEIPNNPNKKEGDRFFQLRYACMIDKVLEQTPDPDNGRIHGRKFVPKERINKEVKWGNSGRALFADAIAWFEAKVRK